MDYNVFLVLLTLMSNQLSHQSFTRFSEEFDAVVAQNKTYIEASSYCRERNLSSWYGSGSTRYASVNNVLTKINSLSLWLGIKKKTLPGLQWLDDTSLEKGIIPRVNQEEQLECGFLVPRDQYLAVDQCKVNNYGYICEEHEGTCNKTKISSQSFVYQKRCFTLNFEPVSWSVASLRCRNRGSVLAQMKTKKTIGDICMKISEVHRDTIYYWIGLRKAYWYFDDHHNQRELNESRWLAGQPAYGANCAILSYSRDNSFGWKTSHCMSRENVLCLSENDIVVKFNRTTPANTTKNATQYHVPNHEGAATSGIIIIIVGIIVPLCFVLCLVIFFVVRPKFQHKLNEFRNEPLLAGNTKQTKKLPTSDKPVWYTCVCSDSIQGRYLRLVPVYKLEQKKGKHFTFSIYVLDTHFIQRDYDKIKGIIICDKGVSLSPNCNEHILKASMKPKRNWRVKPLEEHTRKIHEYVGCHNKGEPKLIAKYDIHKKNSDMTLNFSLSICKGKKYQVFSEDLPKLETRFIIKKPVISGSVELILNLFKCEEDNCKDSPTRRLTLRPMCFLHVADPDKSLYWLRIYVLDWYGPMDTYLKELQLIEQEDNYYFGEVLQLPNKEELPADTNIIVKLHEVEETNEYDRLEIISNIDTRSQGYISTGPIEETFNREYLNNNTQTPETTELFQQVQDILNCHTRKKCQDPLSFKVMTKDVDKLRLTVTIDTRRGIEAEDLKINLDFTNKLASDVISTHLDIDVQRLFHLRSLKLCQYECGHNRSKPRRLSIMPVWSFYKDIEGYTLDIYLIDVVYNWDYAQIVRGLHNSHRVAYTGERVRVPNIDILKQENTLQLMVNTEENGWKVVGGENVKQISLGEIARCHDNNEKAPYKISFTLQEVQQITGSLWFYTTVCDKGVKMPLEKDAMIFDIESDVASQRISTQFEAFLNND